MNRLGITAVLTLLLLIAGCGDDNETGAAIAPTLAQSIAVNTHYGAGTAVDRVALAKLRAAGVHVLRNDLNWAAVEPTRGVYDFQSTGYDDLVDAATAEGMRLLFILDYGNRLYGPESAVITDSGRTAYAAFASAAAQRYRGHHFIWEVWNEPNLGTFWHGGTRPDPAMYARLVMAAAPAIRAADPSATILMGAVYTGFPDLVPLVGGIPGLQFFQGLFATGALQHVDGVTAHPYRAEAPETVVETVDAIRAQMAAAGRTLPLWSGEWGYTTYDPNAPPTNVNTLPALTLDRQASYAARLLLNNFRLGLVTSVWYDDRDPRNPPPGDMEAHFGLLNDDLSPKPSYNAVATVNQVVGDGRLAGELALGAGKYGLNFDTPRGRVTALWAIDTVTWSLQFGAGGGRVIGRDGQVVTITTTEGTQTLAVQPDDGPIYLLGDVRVAGS